MVGARKVGENDSPLQVMDSDLFQSPFRSQNDEFQKIWCLGPPPFTAIDISSLKFFCGLYEPSLCCMTIQAFGPQISSDQCRVGTSETVIMSNYQ